MKNNRFRKALVMFDSQKAGIIEETEQGYRFTYYDEFIEKNISISVSLPIGEKVFESKNLFSFFAGLLPEGWYLDMVCKKLKIDEKDSFGILLATCKDTIGAVSIEEIK